MGEMQNESPKLPPLDEPAQVIVPEVMPAESTSVAQPAIPPPQVEPPKWLTKNRLRLAFAIALISDVLSFGLFLAPPVQIVVDLFTAALLFIVLGWRWGLLLGLVFEAIPGLYLLPAWVLVVGAIAIWGTARPKLY